MKFTNILKTTLMLAATLPCAMTQAQEAAADSAKTKETENEAMETVIKVYQKQLDERDKQIESLKAAEAKLNDSIATLNKQLAKQEADTKQQLKASAGTEEKMASLKAKYDELVNAVSTLDGIVYKNCLLYPLETRYDPKLIVEAVRAVNSFSQLPTAKSSEFEQYKKTYLPLLKQYGEYNKELGSFFAQKLEIIKMTGNVVRDAHRDKFTRELEALPYFQKCYKGRNNPPYSSIVYLDEAIDKFKAIIAKTGDVSKEMEELIKSIEPKQNTNGQ
jgi:septal ring factor EnvC (AmiA/AmiB activator)